MKNDISQPSRCTRNTQNEIREPDGKDFVLDDMKNELNEEDDIELKFDKELNKI